MESNKIATCIILMVVLSIVVASGYVIYTGEQYKTIEMSGFKVNVPDNEVTVIKNTSNYYVYSDRSNNITIYALSSNASSDGDIEGGLVISEYVQKYHSFDKIGYNNITLGNSSGNYTYFDNSTGSWIYIESNDLELITYMAKSLEKPENGTMTEKVMVNFNSS